MRKSFEIAIFITFLLSVSIVGHVWADGYEAETVGGILEPTNFVMMLFWAVFIGICILGVFIALGLIRIEKEKREGN